MPILKEELVQKLHRLNKAEAYMDSNAPEVEKDKWQANFQSILRDVCNIYDKLKETREITQEEYLKLKDYVR